MDDKLYYVESPDGKVLGPMSMIHILEGIAAGAILDTARICEVGRQEWVELSEVAYTHDDEPPVAPQVPAAHVPPARVPDPSPASEPATPVPDPAASSVETPIPDPAASAAATPIPDPGPTAGVNDPTDFGLADLEPTDPVDDLDFEIPDPVDDEVPDVVDHQVPPMSSEPATPVAATPIPEPDSPTPAPDAEPSLLETPVPEAGLGEVPEPAEMPVPFEASPDPIEPFEPTPTPEATPTAAETQELPLSAFPEDPAPSLPASAFPEDPSQLPASAFPEDPSQLPASAFPEDPSQLPASAFPADGPGAGASDFQLEMPGPDEEEDLEEEVAEEKPRSRKWVAIVAIALVIPILGGIYHLAGGPSPWSDAGDDVADVGAGAPTDQAPSAAEEGWTALSEGKLKRAVKRFDAALAEDATQPRTHHGRGLAALRLGDTGQAIASFERSLELDAANSQVRTDLGRAQLASGNTGAALASAQRVLDLDPTWAAARRLLGEAQLASGDPEAAVVTLTEHLRSRPDDAQARLALANAFAETGRLEPAIDEIHAYLGKNPEDRTADARRLEWLQATGREAEAALLYAALANERPDDAHVQYLAGLAHPDSDEGVAYLERAVALDASNTDAQAALVRYRRAGYAAAAPKKPAPSQSAKPLPPTVETAAADPAPADETPAPRTSVVPEPVRPEPEPLPEPEVTLAQRIDEIRGAVEKGSGAAAREALEKAQAENRDDAGAMRNLALWAAILDFHEGQIDAALAAFDRLDPAASYADAGFGPGAIQNWQARANLAKGDVRGAIAVLDGVGREDADEYAQARLWEGVALASLGMTELAERTWERVPEDVGAAVGPAGKGAVKSAEYLSGAISAKDYRTAVGSIQGFENDMHFVLGFQARRSDELEVARAHFRKVIEASNGHEFPYDLAQAEVAGNGLTGEWPAE